MNKEDWDRVKKSCETFFSSAVLSIDEYEVTLQLVRVSTYKNAIQFFINGVFKGEWLTKDCEERRRFFCMKEKSLMNKKEKQDFLKLTKKMQKELNDKYDSFKYTYYQSMWTSFSALKKHFIANNKDIKIKRISGE